MLCKLVKYCRYLIERYWAGCDSKYGEITFLGTSVYFCLTVCLKKGIDNTTVYYECEHIINREISFHFRTVG